jgi:uroporphyrinogen-III synthase
VADRLDGNTALTARVLVTRSAPGGELLCRRLAESGWRVIYGPPIRLEPASDPDATAARLHQLLPADRVILTSSRAVEEALRLIPPELLAAASVIVPGPGTARVARRLGLAPVLHPEHAGTSEDLLKLPALQHLSGLRVVILAAHGGRRFLGEALAERGAQVERVHVYRRVEQALPPELLAADRTSEPVITLISSGAVLESLHRQLPDRLWKKLLGWPIVVPSARIARQAASLGCACIIEAGRADDDAMIESLSAPAVQARLR